MFQKFQKYESHDTMLKIITCKFFLSRNILIISSCVRHDVQQLPRRGSQVAVNGYKIDRVKIAIQQLFFFFSTFF